MQIHARLEVRTHKRDSLANDLKRVAKKRRSGQKIETWQVKNLYSGPCPCPTMRVPQAPGRLFFLGS